MKLKLTKDPSHKGYYKDENGNLYVFRFGGRPIKVDSYRDDKPKENVNRDEVTVNKEKVIDHSKTATEKDDKEYNKEIEIEKKKAKDNMEPVLKYSQEFSMQSPVNDLEAAQNYLSDDDMTKYVPDELVNVVQKAEWVLDDESSGHINIETSRELSAEEQKILSDWIDGQNSDGLGEGFEQQQFAESYFDPYTGDGPYTYSEAEEEISRKIEEMDYSDYESYISEEDKQEAIDNYIKYNGLEETDDEEIRDGYLAEISDDPFSYIDDNAIYDARDRAAMDNPDYDVNEWYNMSSMRTYNKEFEISEVQNLNQDVELESMVRNSNAEYSKYGDVIFHSREDFKNFGQTIADKLNEKYGKDYGADFRYRLNKNDTGGEYLEFYDANESVESTHHIYEDLAKEVKSYFGEEGTDVFVEPYDNVSTLLAGFYGRDYEDEEVEEAKHAGWELYSDDPNRYGDLREYNEKMNPTKEPELIDGKDAVKEFERSKQLGKEWEEDLDRELNTNLDLMVRYSGTVQNLKAEHPDWPMTKIMAKIKKLDEED